MKDLEKSGKRIVKLLQSQGFQAFWVGGGVRDKILKRESDNMDIATDALPSLVERVLKKNKLPAKNVGQGRQLGTILTIVDRHQIEITTFRAEGFYSNKRHPDQIQFIQDYLQDAKRRDFTINAMYYDPVVDKLYDPTGGQKDLKAKLIRFVGDPKKRIDEDSLRMLRAVRFASQFGFKLEKNTFAAIKTRAKYIQGVSGERIKKELDKILMSKNRAEGIKLLDAIGLLRFIVSEFEAIKNFYHKSKHYHLEGSIFDHTLLALKQPGIENLDLYYALLFHDIGKPVVAKRIKKDEGWVISSRGHNDSSAEIFLKYTQKLKFPKESAKTIEWLIRNHMLQTSFAEMHISKQIKLVSHENAGLLLEHWRCDEAANVRNGDPTNHVARYKRTDKVARVLMDKIRKARPVLDKLAKGDLIMQYSDLRPGPKLGQKIEEIKTRIILGQIRTEKDLKQFLA